MIASVVKTASDRLSAQRDSTTQKIKQAASSDEYENEERCEHGMVKTECVKGCKEKTASFTDVDFVHKLASACDYISENVENIAPPNRGVLGAALQKLAENGLPTDRGVAVPPTNPEGALHVTTPPNGEQQYKKDKPKGDDAAADESGTAETKANMPGGSTQIANNMGSAPGGGGQVPSATYPKDGPFHSGGSGGEKTAGRLSAAAAAAKKGVGRAGELLAGGKKSAPWHSATESRPGNSLRATMHHKDVAGHGSAARATEGRKANAARAGAAATVIGGVGASQHGKKKTAGEIAREMILQKLAGEDVMKANISSPQSGGPLVGEGELEALISDQVPSNPTDGSGYGNDQRRLIQSNEAAIDYTKADAKKPQGKQMSEVLNEPAFSPEHDSKLREQLQNAGEAGVKIAGAAVVPFLKQAAAQGVLTQETVNSFKAKTKTASDLAPHGATQGGSPPDQDAAVSKLRNMMDAQRKHKGAMGDPGGGGSFGGGTY
jgi:hypothetical protein